MKNKNINIVVTLSLLVAVAISMGGCAANPPPANIANVAASQPANGTNSQTVQRNKSEASFINKVWKVNKSNGATTGQIYVFISDGTLAMTSPNGKPSFGSWSYKEGILTMLEEGVPRKVDIVKLTNDEFNIKINDPGKGVEIEFTLASESEVAK
jgi:hypothetical protein